MLVFYSDLTSPRWRLVVANVFLRTAECDVFSLPLSDGRRRFTREDPAVIEELSTSRLPVMAPSVTWKQREKSPFATEKKGRYNNS